MDGCRDVACYVFCRRRLSSKSHEVIVARARRCKQRLYAHSVLSPPPVATVKIASISVSIFAIMPDIMMVVAEVRAIASQIVLVTAFVLCVARIAIPKVTVPIPVNVTAVLAAIKAVVPKIAPVLPGVAAVSANILPDRKRRSKYRKAQQRQNPSSHIASLVFQAFWPSAVSNPRRSSKLHFDFTTFYSRLTTLYATSATF